MTDKVTRRPAQGPRVAVAQIAPALGDIQANIIKHREAVEQAVEESADILVFPELSLTGYRLKDSVPEVAIGRHDELMNELAALSEKVSILVGLVAETREHHFFNCGVYFEDGQIRHTHRKVYLPTYGMFDEQRYFARGRRIIAFDTKHGRMAVLICEDMLHPTAATIAALDGATTILVPSASPVRGVVSDDDGGANARHWRAHNQAMARALGVFVVYANRTGVEDGHTFWGGSEIIGPDGEPLAQAAYYQAGLVSAVLTPEALRRKRIQAPVIRDEDIDLTINELARIRGRAGDRCDVIGDQQPRARTEGERQPPIAASRDSTSDERGARGYQDDRRSRGGGGYQDDRRSRGGGGGYQDDRRSRGGGGGYQDDRRSRGGGGGYQDDRRSRGGGGGYQDDRRSRGGGGGYQDDRRSRGGGGGYQDDRRSRGGGGGYQDDRRSRGGGGGYQDDRRPRGGGGGGYQDDRRSRGGGGGGYQDDRRSRGGGGGGYQDDRRSRGGGGGGYQDDRRPRGGPGHGGPAGFGGAQQREDSPQRERPNRGERRPRPVGGGAGPGRGGRDRGKGATRPK